MKIKPPKYGYAAVTADFFHIGHLRYLKKCKEKCSWLIVGVMTDECVEKYKGKRPIMNLEQRMEIVRSLSFVYKVHAQDSFQFDHFIDGLKNFYGKDFVVFDTEEHKRKGADIVIPRIKNISSSLFKRIVNENSNHSQLSV